MTTVAADLIQARKAWRPLKHRLSTQKLGNLLSRNHDILRACRCCNCLLVSCIAWLLIKVARHGSYDPIMRWKCSRCAMRVRKKQLNWKLVRKEPMLALTWSWRSTIPLHLYDYSQYWWQITRWNHSPIACVIFYRSQWVQKPTKPTMRPFLASTDNTTH